MTQWFDSRYRDVSYWPLSLHDEPSNKQTESTILDWIRLFLMCRSCAFGEEVKVKIITMYRCFWSIWKYVLLQKQHNTTLLGEKCMEAKTAQMCYNSGGSATLTRLCMQIRTNSLSLTHFPVSKMCFNNVNPYSVELQWLGPSTKHYFEFGFIVFVIFQANCWTRAGSSFLTCQHSWKCMYSYLLMTIYSKSSLK